VKIYRFDAEAGHTIEVYDSLNVVLSPMVRTVEPAKVSCFYLGPSGMVGYHQATVPQLLAVVQGEGWVRGQDSDKRSIVAGQAAYWTEGEWHESGTETGMTAVVIESESLQPAQFMPEVLQ
jgi:quercetin dioxygenase-like cupin family protein